MIFTNRQWGYTWDIAAAIEQHGHVGAPVCWLSWWKQGGEFGFIVILETTRKLGFTV